MRILLQSFWVFKRQVSYPMQGSTQKLDCAFLLEWFKIWNSDCIAVFVDCPRRTSLLILFIFCIQLRYMYGLTDHRIDCQGQCYVECCVYEALCNILIVGALLSPRPYTKTHCVQQNEASCKTCIWLKPEPIQFTCMKISLHNYYINQKLYIAFFI